MNNNHKKCLNKILKLCVDNNIYLYDAPFYFCDENGNNSFTYYVHINNFNDNKVRIRESLTNNLIDITDY